MIAGSPEPSGLGVKVGRHIPLNPLSTAKQALFHGYIDKSAGPDGCWRWTGSHDGNGYGKFKVDGGICGRTHRLAYFLAHGVDPAEMMVCHTCDNPGCCNPAHLWLGTNSQNQLDCEAKGRRPKRPVDGERNGNAKLSLVDLGKVREMIAGGSTNKAIARVFGVTHQAISRVRRGRSWGSEPMQPKYQSLRR